MSKLIRMVSCRCLAAVCFVLILAGGAWAQQGGLRVAAVVNEDVVTMLDLEQRIKLALLSSSLPDTPDVRNRVAGQVLRRLIDEHLQNQEAKRLKISIGKNEIANGVVTIERQNKMPVGSFEPFLKKHGIDPETLHQQIRAEMLWIKVIRQELVPDVRIGEEEIDARLQALQSNLGKLEYLGGEIVLPVDSPSRDEEMRTLAMNLIEMMRKGTPFSAVARQFSASGASAGGDLGWVSEGMIDDELMARLSHLEKGNITPPFRLADGYHILLLRDKRIASQLVDSGPIVALAHATYRPMASSSPTERQLQIQRLVESLNAAKDCDDFERRGRKLISTEVNRTDMVRLSEFPPEIQAPVKALSVGQRSELIDLPNQKRMYMVCRREESSGGLPTRDEIRRRLEDERVNLMAVRHMRDIRRAAFVEIRI